MDEVRRRTAQALATLRETLALSRQARDTAHVDGREEFARHEDDAIAEVEQRIAWLERQAAAFGARQARRVEKEEW
jgi:hypothetical protein